MGNYCRHDPCFEEECESFAKRKVNSDTEYIIFSKRYKLERDEEVSLSLIDQIEPNCLLSNEVYKKKKRAQSCIQHPMKQIKQSQEQQVSNSHLKPALKESSQNSSSPKQHTNKTVRWDNKFQNILVK